MPESRPPARRLFFALWPDPQTAGRLESTGEQLHGICGGRLVRRDMLHMTLLFLGNIPEVRLDNLRRAAARVSQAGFTLQIDRCAVWRHKQLAWAGCSQAAPGLLNLVGELDQRLRAEGVTIEAHKFVAHVTLARKASAVALPTPAAAAFDWPVSDFVLVESQLLPQGAHYAIIGRWPLLSAVGQG